MTEQLDCGCEGEWIPSLDPDRPDWWPTTPCATHARREAVEEKIGKILDARDRRLTQAEEMRERRWDDG